MLLPPWLCDPQRTCVESESMNEAEPSTRKWTRGLGGREASELRAIEGGVASKHTFLRQAPTLRAVSSSHAALNHVYVDHPSPVIAHGCLLIPVAFGFWWYWTKRTVRRVFRGLLTYTSNAECMGPTAAKPTENAYYKSDHRASSSNADQFHSWEDVMHQERQDDNTSRFVRWFHGSGTRNSRARRRVHAATLHNLRDGPSLSPIMSLSEDSDDMATIHMAFSNATSRASALTWQCIQNTTGGVEICALEARRSQSSETLLSNEEILARSASSYGLVESVSSRVTFA